MSRGNIIRGVNGERILWALNQFNLDAETFGKTMRISKFAQKLQDGVFTFNQLAKIADKLGYSVLFFMAKGAPDIKNTHSIHYRTLAQQHEQFDVHLSKTIKQVENHRDMYISVLDDLNEPVPEFNPPKLTGTIKEKAAATRQWLGLELNGRYDFDAYKKKIAKRGILVFQSMGYQGKWKSKHKFLEGFAIHNWQAPVVYVVKEREKSDDKTDVVLSKQRRSFTLFHELAHILLHRQDKIDSVDSINNESNRYEKEANRFAGACLVPDELIADISVPRDVGLYDAAFQGLAKRAGVSVEVIVLRFVHSNKIRPSDYDNYKKWYKKHKAPFINSNQGNGSRDYRHREPVHIFGESYVRTILNGLSAKHITLNKASDYLDNLSIPNVQKLKKELLERQ